MAQMSLLGIPQNPNDVVFTPDWLAKEIIEHFAPVGVCLDPCKGDGAFYNNLPAGSHWCEITEGKDFFQWTNKVDWIISNPPFSGFFEFLTHSFTIADNIVYVVPFNKVFNAWRNLVEIAKYGGIKEIYLVGKGTEIGWKVGFAIAAVHFQRGYEGGITMQFSPRLTLPAPDLREPAAVNPLQSSFIAEVSPANNGGR